MVRAVIDVSENDMHLYGSAMAVLFGMHEKLKDDSLTIAEKNAVIDTMNDIYCGMRKEK